MLATKRGEGQHIYKKEQDRVLSLQQSQKYGEERQSAEHKQIGRHRRQPYNLSPEDQHCQCEQYHARRCPEQKCNLVGECRERAEQPCLKRRTYKWQRSGPTRDIGRSFPLDLVLQLEVVEAEGFSRLEYLRGGVRTDEVRVSCQHLPTHSKCKDGVDDEHTRDKDKGSAAEDLHRSIV